MDDDHKKFPRGKGPKPGAPRGRPGSSGKGGKRPFDKNARADGKPLVKREGARKPHGSRTDRSAAEGERPNRDFKRDFKPRGTGGEGAPRDGRPFHKGPRQGQRYERRDAGGSGKQPGRFERGDRPAAAEGAGGEKRFDRPKRDFGGDRPKRNAGGPAAGGFKPRPRPADAGEEVGERIAKRLARAGLASRRDAEELIAAGRVKVNGRALTSPAFNVMPDDIIHLDGLEIPPIERTRLFLFHKPAGVVTTNRDPEGRKTVFDVLPADLPRLMTIGRLDINTEGLLLLTNDGGLSRVLELPATGWLRRYRVRVHGKVEEQALAGLREGIAVDGVFYGAIEASLDREQGSNAWLTLGLREGKNREVRNILGALGLEVTRLIRVSYGPFQLGELPEGHVLEIKGRMLRDQLGERLIEESGANFDAEIAKPFSNRPVRRTETRADESERPKIPRDGERGRIGEGGLIKSRKRREASRDEALGKLSTKPDRPERERHGGKPERGGFGGKPQRGPRKSEREQRPIEPPGQRKANVWMAPGARPIGKGRAEADAAKAAEAKTRKPARGKPDFGKGRNRPSAALRAPSPREGGEKRAPTSAPPSPRLPWGEGKGEGQRGGSRPRGKAPGKGPKR